MTAVVTADPAHRVQGKAAFEIAGCAGKFAFPALALARKVARRMRRKGKGSIQPYRCEFCGAWHIGRPRGGR